MSLDRIMNEAISPWMKGDGPDSDIVLSTRIRLARNLKNYHFPIMQTAEEANQITELFQQKLVNKTMRDFGSFELLKMNELTPLQRRVLVEKHLISPNLAETEFGACILSESEHISVMLNEEDHVRIQCLFPGLQLSEALQSANKIDNAFEEVVEYAFDEELGYVTSCPTNVGTGLRASVMIHLPALVLTKRINRIIQAIQQLGLVVRGIYGEGSEALGNIFQVSNQMTLGKSEEDIIADLTSVIHQLIQQEKAARELIVKNSSIELEDKVYRSYGILAHSRLIQSAEAATCLSDVRLGIDLGYIKDVSRNILTELMVLTQPGILQQYAGGQLGPEERDYRRAALIRERLRIEENEA
ncbi:MULTISPECIES: protein arginine kinase [Bacillus cereus group]|uniref:Protein-arginine kinase n=1 Tax=Bacillus cytotoxicus TaxID=580165 RepID=A0AAX2CB65_9BACI|nr:MULTISPECIES: protein arginine kinase [Bacillus cereus group]MDH2890177.1 protein arginine kinase [Bacillus cytotoxicus]QTR83849.1 protein arginine kinase [Bacillus cytotoxicus]QTR87585.1 protein arginine kinase [Bacillus cytotoxicus]SCL81837.1 A7GJZ2 Protein-arginine kinase [Bacillus cytotoxicus]HDR4572964.1 protein arginine kinase [Bacillus cytotoxicus]